MGRRRSSTEFSAFREDPLWYKDAIIYEVHVRAFFDSDGDGIGDFRGLTARLDYLQDLGVTAIWLLPFYPSPLRDDGYDIADYTDVHPNYGTLQDFRALLRGANQRGINVITEMILNHTSDQHPWFQRARQAPTGTRWRDFYVWANNREKYKEARVIFKDFESSNWTWDPAARAYYWHRFYWHQPDLNYDKPHVRRAVTQMLDFWLKMGVSGLRLDAVPYLYEREGTNCENLPETHAFLKQLRQHVDQRFRNRMLLAEANQWPEDAAAYFGEGDECHMAYHFPLMPRLFMAIRMEDRFPIIDILDQTPSIPESCQWALFLRNHDELTLEMVADEERDYMYRVYARDARMRVNLGIRRRLAPLLNNDRKKIELMNGLLFSLPGTPVVYYGDEVGMGDNFYLGDRNGVRTPMQWSADRNAGFSSANAQRLYLPLIIDPEYHYETVNVDAQQNNPDSLLWWMKRIIALRKRLKALSRGSLEFLYPENRKVLALVRRYQDEIVLVVANLSRLAQHTHLNLAQFAGRVPVEVFGHTEFPRIGEDPYFVTLSPYAFYWFSLNPQREPEETAKPREAPVPTVTMTGKWENLLKKSGRPILEEVLLSYVRQRRWFGGKARRTQAAQVLDIVPMPNAAAEGHLVLVQVDYAEGEPETYLVPLTFAVADQADHIVETSPTSVIAYLDLTTKGKSAEGLLCDALSDVHFCHSLLNVVWRRRKSAGNKGELKAWPTRMFRSIRGPAQVSLEPIPLKGEQSNTSVVYGDRLILKLFRRLGQGTNPELEVGRFLTEKVSFPRIPPLAGAVEYRRDKESEPVTLAVLQGYVQNQGDAWGYTIDSLGHYFERVLAQPAAEEVPPLADHLLALAEKGLPPMAEETVGPYLAAARLLGQQTGQLHTALASRRDDPAFAPEPFSLTYQRSVYHAMRVLTIQNLQMLRGRLRSLPADARESAQHVLDMEHSIIERFQPLRQRKITAMRIRCHGDYHLGQVLYTGKDFVIFDFEGEPARPLTERRIKRSPLRDVAGMIRSFHYAAHAALLGQAPTVIRSEDRPLLEQWARLWYRWVSATFLEAYLAEVEQASLLPPAAEDLNILLDSYLLEKALYELGYELNNRPAWVTVPLQGILQSLEARP